MRCVPVLLFLFCGIALHAGVNLFSEDTSFETGTQNFRYYRSDFPIRQIRNDAVHGTSSLEIDSSESWAQGLWMYSLKKNTDYTVSFYARRVSGGNTWTVPGQSGQQTAGKLHSPICVALCGTVRCLMRKFGKNKELTLILQDQNDTFRTAGCKG